MEDGTPKWVATGRPSTMDKEVWLLQDTAVFLMDGSYVFRGLRHNIGEVSDRTALFHGSDQASTVCASS